MAWRNPERLSVDVDVVSEGVTLAVRRAAESVSERFGVDRGWLNDAAKMFVVSLPADPEAVFLGKRLRVYAPSGRYLLAMKLLAARPSDREDVVLLLRETGIRSEKELHDLIEAASGGRPVSMTVAHRASELLTEARGSGLLGRLRTRWRRKPGRRAAVFSERLATTNLMGETEQRAARPPLRLEKAAACGASLTSGGRCRNLVLPSTRRCPAGHRPTRR